jgi:hypothetical protein
MLDGPSGPLCCPATSATIRLVPPRPVQAPAAKAKQPYVIGAFRVHFEQVTMPDGWTYLYNPDPVVDLIHTLSQLESGMSGEQGQVIADALMEGNDLILDLLRQWNPDDDAWRELNGVPTAKELGDDEEPVAFPKALRLTAMELYEVCSLISGGESAAKQIAETLNAVAQMHTDADAETNGTGGSAESVPLKKPSSGRSRGSAKKTTGRRTTGKTSPGASGDSNTTKRAVA